MTAAGAILIIKHGAFGDIVQSVGAVEDIRRAHPSEVLAVLTGSAFADFYARCPWVDRIVTDRRRPFWDVNAWRRLHRDLRQLNVKRVYDLQNSDRTEVYFHTLLRRTVWSGTARGCALPHRAHNRKSLPPLPRLAGQLRDAGLMPERTERPDLTWLAADPAPLLAAYGFAAPPVLLLPGSSPQHTEKRWPHFRQLAEDLRQSGISVAAVPGLGEHGLTESLGLAMLSRPDDIRSLPELAGLLAAAPLVVGNDSGPTHLAAHLGTRTVALFGNYYPARLTSIARANVTILEVTDLDRLPPRTVFDCCLDQLAVPGPLPPSQPRRTPS